MINRETYRDLLAAGLTAELITDEGVVAAGNIHSHRIYDPEGQSPVVGVFSMGSGRKRLTLAGGGSGLRFGVEIWVRAYGDSWTAAQAEDLIDLLEKHVADYVDENRSTANWTIIDWEEGGSEIAELTIGGHPYLAEVVPVIVHVNG